MPALGKIRVRSTACTPDLSEFLSSWSQLVARECHAHTVWDSKFMRALRQEDFPAAQRFQLAATWSVNMIPGSYCFPAYVAALAARAQSDGVRHGLLENAWDESGGTHHASRSHFWLAVRLGRLLGLSDEDIESLKPLPQAEKYMQEHQRACTDESFEFGLGAICLIEEFTTPEFSALFRALQSACEQGLAMPATEFILRGGAEYFTANIADDERHREQMPRLVAMHLIETGIRLSEANHTIELANIASGMRFSIELRERFFDDIYEHVMRGGTYRDLCR